MENVQQEMHQIFFQNQHIFWFKGVIETDIFQNWILAGDLAQGKWSSTSMKSL